MVHPSPVLCDLLYFAVHGTRVNYMTKRQPQQSSTPGNYSISRREKEEKERTDVTAIQLFVHLTTSTYIRLSVLYETDVMNMK